MPRTHVIIPVHNRREITHRCLAHLQAQGVPAWAKVIVIDDGSTDGTRPMIEADFPWVKVLPGTGHLWWAGAIHLGMRHAIADGSECILWLNDDCLPDAAALPLLISTATTHGAVCGAACRGADGRPLAYGGGFFKGSWPAPLLPPLPTKSEISVHWLHGNLVAIPQSVWRRIGLPECHRMRHNLSDIDYTHRAHRFGIPVLLLPQATAVASINDNLSYRSWVDPKTGPWDLLSGLWNPRAWWYAPGLASFLARQHGWRAPQILLHQLVKIFIIIFLKALMPREWVAGMTRLPLGSR